MRLWVAISAVALAGLALGHPDVPVADGSYRLAAGESVSFRVALHYHRMVGDIRLDEAAGDVSLSIVDETVESSGEADAASGALVWLRSFRESGSFHPLVRCCVGATWAPYRWVVRNDGPVARTVDIRAWAVHDDFAVVVDRAEGGALEVPLSIFVGLAIVGGWVVLRRRNGFRGDAPLIHLPRAFSWSVALGVAAMTLAGGLGIAGALRYGADPVVGMVAIMADLPVPGGPFGSRDALVMGILLLAWTAAFATWIRAVSRGAGMRSPWVGVWGVVLGLVTLMGGTAMGLAYGAFAVPVGLGAVLGVPFVGYGMLTVVRRRPGPAGTVPG